MPRVKRKGHKIREERPISEFTDDELVEELDRLDSADFNGDGWDILARQAEIWGEKRRRAARKGPA